MRVGGVSGGRWGEADTIQDAVFRHLPTDRGHFSVPYLAHVLGGLRHQPPDYVQDLLAGRTPPRWVTEAVAGIVVIRDSEPASRDLSVSQRLNEAITHRWHVLPAHTGVDERPAPAAVLRPVASWQLPGRKYRV